MKLLTAIILVFVGVLAIMIGSRIDQQLMAILAGAILGFVVAAVAVGIVALVLLEKGRIGSLQSTTHTRPAQPLPPAPQHPAQNPYTAGYSLPMYEIREPNAPPMYPPHVYPPPSLPAPYADPRYAAYARPPMPQTPMLAPPRRFFVIGASGQSEEMSPDTDEPNDW